MVRKNEPRSESGLTYDELRLEAAILNHQAMSATTLAGAVSVATAITRNLRELTTLRGQAGNGTKKHLADGRQVLRLPALDGAVSDEARWTWAKELDALDATIKAVS